MASNEAGDRELGEALIRANHADYIKSPIKEELEGSLAILLGTDEWKSFPLEVMFVALLVIFSHIDLFGSLYKGKSTAQNSIAFLREYFGRVNPLYQKIGGVLYDSLRHGLVHLNAPKRVLLTEGYYLDFLFGGGEKQNHLVMSKANEQLHTGENALICRLLINVDTLYEDLLSAIDLFYKDVRDDEGLANIYWASFENRRLENEAKINQRYHCEEDFLFIRSEIAKL